MDALDDRKQPADDNEFCRHSPRLSEPASGAVAGAPEEHAETSATRRWIEPGGPIKLLIYLNDAPVDPDDAEAARLLGLIVQ